MSTDHAVAHETKRDALLRLLSDREWHAHHQLASVAGVRYSARLLELKRLGYTIDTVDIAAQGRAYRMPTLERGAPRLKRVKVLLEEADVLQMVHGHVPSTARHALSDAHASFDANRAKL